MTELHEFRKILKKRKPTFLRKDTFKKSKLGRKRKKKQKWKRPRGRHSKLREKWTGYMIQPSIGWSSPKAVRGLVQELKPKLIFNAAELDHLKEGEIGVVGKIGKKNKMEIAEKAAAKNIRLLNLNAKKFIKRFKKELEKKKEEKSKVKKTTETKQEKKEEKKEEGKKEIKEEKK